MIKDSIESIYPLSPMQQGMLFHTLYTPGSGAYFEQLSCVIRGPLDEELWVRAWQRSLEQNPILRSAFVWKDVPEPLQIVGRGVELPVERLDWRGRPEEERQHALATLCEADRRRSFQLAEAPLTRLTLIAWEENVWQFLWSFHHVLLDGWSCTLLLEEVFEGYETLRRQQQPRYQPRRPYLDYISWLRQQDPAAAEQFWRRVLAGLKAPTPLGIDRGPGAAGETAGRCGVGQGRVAESTTSALQAFARRHQLTLNTLLQGAWAVLLSRYSGTGDVVFGATVSGRPASLAGVETMVGLFINTLPVRVRVDAQADLAGWLRQLQSEQAEARQYDYTSLAAIQAWSEIPGHQPLFDSLLVFENYPDDGSLQQPDSSLRLEQVRVTEQSNYPLTLMAKPGPALLLRVLYDEGRFPTAAITRMLGHLETILASMTDPATRCVGDLDLLSAGEQQQLAEWNDTATPYPREATIPELFEEQAERTPDAVAVIYEDRQLTYHELNARANQLAHHLRLRGVGPDVTVGVCLERSAEMIVTLLAILKAGGAYLPLDPSFPPQRLAAMIDEAAAVIVVTEDGSSRSLSGIPIQVITTGPYNPEVRVESSVNPAPLATASNLAYIVYTSGSTGRPKGIMIPHRAVIRLLFNTNYIAIEASDVVGQASTISFDAATFEIWGALLHGARIVGIPKDTAISPCDLGRALDRWGVTLLFVTTALFNQIVDEATDALSNLRVLLFGGEAVDPERVGKALAGSHPGRLLHVYGPTESTTFASWHSVGCVSEKARTVPIGRALSNTRLYVLDSELQPVAIGLPGELYVAGDGLARGYTASPAMTAEKFLPDPFNPVEGARMYRTGDQVILRPNGEIEFIGRYDHQVKIRGFRIELSEIEFLLNRHPKVQAAVVKAAGSVPGERRLVMYIVSRQGESPTPEELGGYLRTWVPEYMVPAALVLIDHLPLTPNGKVDRGALPEARMNHPESANGHVAPGTPLEARLATIWAQTLETGRLGLTDNFFDIGGHSLLATRLIARVRQEFEIEISLRSLFEAPTIGGMAAEVTKALAGGRRSTPVTQAARQRYAQASAESGKAL